MAIHGYTWFYMAINCITWVYMAIHGFTWHYMALHGYTWPLLYISWYTLITLLKVPTSRSPSLTKRIAASGNEIGKTGSKNALLASSAHAKDLTWVVVQQWTTGNACFRSRLRWVSIYSLFLPFVEDAVEAQSHFSVSDDFLKSKISFWQWLTKLELFTHWRTFSSFIVMASPEITTAEKAT